MEDRSNKNIMVSVLFLDIVEYSKKLVSEQIALKDRFNAFLSDAIHDMPVGDRIILDTGDGAAVTFLGDVGHALTAALRLRSSLLAQDAEQQPVLLVRIGINHGPVRLVRDINGQPNIVGDGINVAQRVMGFADASQILVSRSYYEGVSRLSAEYAGMFHHQGFRTDKHVREHEVFAIGYPGDQTSSSKQVRDGGGKVGGVASAWSLFVEDMNRRWHELLAKIEQADTRQRIMYVAVVLVPLLIGLLAFIKAQDYSEKRKANVAAQLPVVETLQSVKQVMPEVVASGVASTRHVAEKSAVEKNVIEKRQEIRQADGKVKPADSKSVSKKPPVRGVDHNQATETSVKDVTPEPAAVVVVADAYVSVNCRDGTEVFIDGSRKGVISNGSMTVTVKPGKHKLIASHASFGIYSEALDLDAGKTVRLKPKVCQ